MKALLLAALLALASCGDNPNFYSVPDPDEPTPPPADEPKDACPAGPQGEAGEPGVNGEPGQDGEDGETCTISCITNKTAEISCGAVTVTLKGSNCTETP